MSRTTDELRAAIADALARLEAPRASDAAVHEARKSLKRARAALRLLRDGLEQEAFTAENAALRDAGRRIALLREARAARDALGELHRRYPAARRIRLALPRPPRAGASRAGAAAILRDSLARCERPDFREAGKASTEAGLRRIYGKGRKAFAEARGTRADGALHEWRKQVKYLSNALKVLYGDAPGAPAKLIRRADRVADCLGEAHDLALLSARKPALERFAGERRRTLRKRAFALGNKLYREKPSAFLKDRAISSS